MNSNQSNKSTDYEILREHMNEYYTRVAYTTYDALEISEYIAELRIKTEDIRTELHETRMKLMWEERCSAKSAIIDSSRDADINELDDAQYSLGHDLWFYEKRLQIAENFLRSVTKDILKDITNENHG